MRLKPNFALKHMTMISKKQRNLSAHQRPRQYSPQVTTLWTSGLNSDHKVTLKQHTLKRKPHLEVSKFCQIMRTYMEVGFRGAVPENVWMYLSPIISSSWCSSPENRGFKQKGLEEILADILTESSIGNPVHSRLFKLLKEKRNKSSHSDFLIRLEEKINLI